MKGGCGAEGGEEEEVKGFQSNFKLERLVQRFVVAIEERRPNNETMHFNMDTVFCRDNYTDWFDVNCALIRSISYTSN